MCKSGEYGELTVQLAEGRMVLVLWSVRSCFGGKNGSTDWVGWKEGRLQDAGGMAEER